MHTNRVRWASALTALVFSGLAFAATPDPVWRGYQVNFFGCDASYSCANFSATIYEDYSDRVLKGDISVSMYDPSFNVVYVSCTGPEYANVVSANQATGQTRMLVTLDPSGPGCYGYASDGSTPPVFTINVSGEYDGILHDATTGIVSEQYLGVTTVRSNYQEDCYSESFTGTTTPFVLPPYDVFSGGSCARHASDR